MSPHLFLPFEYHSKSFVPMAPLWLFLGGGLEGQQVLTLPQ